MPTLLPKKSLTETPIAKDDAAQQQLVADPSIPQFANPNSYNTYVGPIPFNQAQFSGFSSPGLAFQNAAYNNFANITGSSQLQPVLTSAGANSAQDADILVVNTNSDWVNKKWRPMMGWLYMLTCTFDFIIFPILWSLLQAFSKGAVTSQWQPLTLQGAGLYHLAMGAVLGIAAYGRTKEKLEGAVK